MGRTLRSNGHTTEIPICRRAFTKNQARGEFREEGPSTIRFGIERLHVYHDFRPHPISFAAQEGHLDIVRYMIDRGVNPNTKNPE